ncbi:MAG: hypothetical protein AB7V48_14040 [Sedimentibacter sp.]
MIKLKRILYISLMFCFIGSYVYGYNYEPLSEEKLKDKLEETYGINIIIPENEGYQNYKECLLILDRGLSRFPQGMIKEITESYSKKGISTNVILSKTEKISDLFSEYKLNEKTADLFITTLQNNLYYDTCAAAELGFVHEMGHYVSDYLYKVYGFEKIKIEFDKLNAGYVYGSWEENYSNAFVNKHSAKSIYDDIADLIYHAEMNPDVIRNINNGNYTVLHKKIEYLAAIIDQSFSSISSESRLWQEALPQKPDAWAIDTIKAMQEASLIPEEFDGIYNSYINKDDFYTLALKVIESKLGKDNFIESFELIEKDNNVTIDPVKGEIFVDDSTQDVLNIETQIYNEKEKRLYEAYQIGLIDEVLLNGKTEYITRLEIARLINYIGNELGVDISNYDVVNYEDISNVNDSDKAFIYFVSSKGLLKGDGTSFKPYEYCTYQEAYIILMRLYDLL